MNNITMVLASTEVLGKAADLTEEFGPSELIKFSKQIIGAQFLSDSSPALREFMVGIVAMLLAGLTALDDTIAAEYSDTDGVEEDVATNG